MSRRNLLYVLISVNVLLAALLCGVPLWPAHALAADDPPGLPPGAAAPPAPLSSRYLAVAGEMQDEYDAVYLLATKNRALLVFVYDRSMRRLGHVAARDLDADFRNK
jgi:hypothetical protein